MSSEDDGDYDGEEEQEGDDDNRRGGGCSGRDGRQLPKKRLGTTSKYRGVYLHRTAAAAGRPKPWQAQIKTEDGIKYIGTFSSEKLAAKAYDRYVRQHGPPGIALNFPNDKPSSKKVSNVIFHEKYGATLNR